MDGQPVQGKQRAPSTSMVLGIGAYDVANFNQPQLI